ncbi:MAG: enoyl-CoA hydratase/isomerase family protein [Hyphomicrobiaceae bacterium]
MAEASTSEIEVQQIGCAATVTLSRPARLNALNDGMRAAIARRLPHFARDPNIYCMVIKSVPESRVFCAGGDLSEIHAEIRSGHLDAARRSFADEYRLNWALECFPKPTVSLINGLVVGSGVGLTLYGTHRVAGENYRFAMPEAAIGLFPDVGVCHALARMPHGIGTYLGLTGAAIDRAEAFALGLVTHCIRADHFPVIAERLADAEPVDALLDGLHQEPGPPPIMALAESIAAVFSLGSVRDMLSALGSFSQEQGARGQWARDAAQRLSSNSPTALEATLKHIRSCATLDLRATLTADYTLACHFLDHADLAEGIRASVVDKDKSPNWSPNTLASVVESDIAKLFHRHASGDLSLPTRAELQKVGF